MFNRNRITFGIVFVILFAFLWGSFAPWQVGGNATLLVLFGNSMEPAYVQGDLVFVRQGESYIVGDIVAYYHPEIGEYVLHRIISIEEGKYVLKGDNNDWVDTYQPRTNEIIGKLWLHIPKVGKILGYIRNPITISVLFAVSSILVIVGGIYGKEDDTLYAETHNEIVFSKRIQTAFTIAVGLFLVAVFVFVIAFTRPAQVEYYQENIVNQVARFSYTGSAPEGIYDQPSLTEGQPIFPSVTCDVHMVFGYLMTGKNLTAISGTYSLAMRIQDKRSGLSRSQTLVPETNFNDTMVNIDQDINFCEIAEMINEIEEKTGAFSSTYIIEIHPYIYVNGLVNGIPFDTEFAPPLTFDYDHLQFSLSPGFSIESVLGPADSFVVEEKVLVPNHISFFGLEIPVLTLRYVSSSLMGISLAMMVWGFVYINKVQKRNPILAQQMLQGVEIFDVAVPQTAYEGNVINISDFGELAKLAVIRHQVIFRSENIGQCIYYFDYERSRYQFIEEEIVDRSR